MKLSALAAQIKGCGHCEVINNGGRIFVGTGSAFYCMDGYPRTQDAGELGAMLGIPQKKRNLRRFVYAPPIRGNGSSMP